MVGAATGAYIFLQTQGVIPDAVKPADFVFSDLVVNPSEAFVGQPIQISVSVTNVGDVEGDTTVNLEVNSVIKESVKVTLVGLSSFEVVEFTVVEVNVGTYTVQIGDLTAFFVLKDTPPESSKIVVSELKAEPVEVWPNEPI